MNILWHFIFDGINWNVTQSFLTVSCICSMNVWVFGGAHSPKAAAKHRATLRSISVPRSHSTWITMDDRWSTDWNYNKVHKLSFKSIWLHTIYSEILILFDFCVLRHIFVHSFFLLHLSFSFSQLVCLRITPSHSMRWNESMEITWNTKLTRWLAKHYNNLL